MSSSHIKPGTMIAELTQLVAGLPDTLEALLRHPARHRPRVVEGLLDQAEELRRRDPGRAVALADAGRRLAAGIPRFFPRDQRFRLRARSLEVWGSLQRDLGDPLAAEGGYLVAFELMSQAGAGPADLAGLLGRQALAAGDRQQDMELARYVKAAILIAEEAGADGPFEVLGPLCEAVMSERGSVLAAGWVALALVVYTNMLALDGTILKPSLRLKKAKTDHGGFELEVRREIPVGAVPWKLSARITIYAGKGCDIYLDREVPASGRWRVDETRGWKVRPARPAEGAAASVEPLPSPSRSP